MEFFPVSKKQSLIENEFGIFICSNKGKHFTFDYTKHDIHNEFFIQYDTLLLVDCERRGKMERKNIKLFSVRDPFKSFVPSKRRLSCGSTKETNPNIFGTRQKHMN